MPLLQYAGALTNYLCIMSIRVEKFNTTTYHLQHNSLLERFNKDAT